ncbi:unnamed protein product [Lactuca virosa]|uniref:KIB1-4 beta-propeller domain-containing protein n=1 Tax=Lactuca virosa TaxID=75947 RepID=A0AAU9LWJ1_9ASTR|nr:unnamed protein product [Lactuca virosa]
MDSETTMKVIANSVFGGDKKILLESMGELFMVDKFWSVGPDNDFDYDDENYGFYEDFDCFMSERTVKLEVYKLDHEEQKWIEVKSLGDRMLFLDKLGLAHEVLN